MFEIEMEEKMLKYLETRQDVLLLGKEVPFLSRCIDIVFLNIDNQLITFELKIKDWRRAIKQALNHKLGADYSYICIPKRKLTPGLQSNIESAKIGLVMFDNEAEIPIEVVLPASYNNNQLIFKQILIDNLSKCKIYS